MLIFKFRFDWVHKINAQQHSLEGHLNKLREGLKTTIVMRCYLQENTHAEIWFQQSCFSTLLKSYFGMGVFL